MASIILEDILDFEEEKIGTSNMEAINSAYLLMAKSIEGPGK